MQSEICFYCKRPIKSEDLVEIEDGMVAHRQCEEEFSQHWAVRTEPVDLIEF